MNKAGLAALSLPQPAPPNPAPPNRWEFTASWGTQSLMKDLPKPGLYQHHEARAF